MKRVPVHLLQHYMRAGKIDAVRFSLRKLPNVEELVISGQTKVKPQQGREQVRTKLERRM
jgi:hypothetical protein